MTKFASQARMVLLISVAAALLAACHMNFSLPPDTPLQLSVYRDAKLVSSRGLAADDGARLAADRWLAANRDGWHYGFRTRPSEIVLAGKDFSIDVLDDEVTVKYCHGFLQCHLWIKKDHELHRALLTAGSDVSLSLPSKASAHG